MNSNTYFNNDDKEIFNEIKQRTFLKNTQIFELAITKLHNDMDIYNFENSFSGKKNHTQSFRMQPKYFDLVDSIKLKTKLSYKEIYSHAIRNFHTFLCNRNYDLNSK